MELNYRKAVQDDAELLIEMYNAAFHADYIRYGECPAYGKTKEAMELSIAGFPKYIEELIRIGISDNFNTLGGE